MAVAAAAPAAAPRTGPTPPDRWRLRSPSFCNLSALKELVVGTYVADAIVILGSLDIVLGEVDK